MEERKRRESDHLSEDDSRPHKKAKKEEGEEGKDNDNSPFDLLPVEMTGLILIFATGGKPIGNRLSTKCSDEELAIRFICRFVCHQWRDLLPLHLSQPLEIGKASNAQPNKGHQRFVIGQHQGEI